MSQPDVSRFMEQLLDGVEVEWVPLKDVLVRTRGTKITAGQMRALHKDGAPLKIFAGGRTVAFVEFGDIPAKDVNREPSIIVKSRGVIEFEYYEKPFSHKSEMWSYHSESNAIHIKFIYHYLKLNEFHFQSVAGRMQMPQIATPDTDNFLIPIPCPDNPKKSLAIQAEIVRILDAFTAMTAELTAELNLRQQQYNHYRDQLLNFDEGEVEWSCLNELTSRTSNIRWQETDETYQYIDLSSVSIENNSITQTTEIDALSAPSRAQKLVQEHDVIFATTRPTQMRICLIPSDYDGAIASTGYCVLRAIQEKVLPKWIYYCLTSTCFKYFLEENQSGSAYPAISDTKLKEFSIPVPSLEEQARIVSILDKFDTLTNSITEGLPREIELRQQQYEYYRDLLFNFPKQEAVA